MHCLIRVPMMASLTTVGATDFSKRQMFFEKVPGVLHQSPNSTTLTCSPAGGCSVFDCTKACLQSGECVVCSHNPAAGRCVLGGPVHANVYASLSSFAVVDAARDTYKEIQASVGSGGLRLKLNVSHYEPEELSIKVTGNHLVISGKHPKRSDEHGFLVAREFTRELLIPEEVDMDTLTSLRTEDGVLVISARVKAELRAQGRSIAIEREDTDKDGKD